MGEKNMKNIKYERLNKNMKVIIHCSLKMQAAYQSKPKSFGSNTNSTTF